MRHFCDRKPVFISVYPPFLVLLQIIRRQAERKADKQIWNGREAREIKREIKIKRTRGGKSRKKGMDYEHK